MELTWETLTNRTKDCLLLGLILVALYIAGNSVSFVFSAILGVAGGAPQELLAVVVNLLLFLWGQVFGAVVMAIALRYLLKLLRGSSEPMRGAFDILPVLWRLVLVQIMISLIAGVIGGGVGMVFMIPLIFVGLNGQPPPAFLVGWLLIWVPIMFCLIMYVWIRFSLAPALIIDRNLRDGVSVRIPSLHARQRPGDLWWVVCRRPAGGSVYHGDMHARIGPRSAGGDALDRCGLSAGNQPVWLIDARRSSRFRERESVCQSVGSRSWRTRHGSARSARSNGLNHAFFGAAGGRVETFGNSPRLGGEVPA